MYIIISKNVRVRKRGNAIWTNTVESPIKCFQEYKKAKDSLLNIIAESTLKFHYNGNRFWSNYIDKTDSVKDNCRYRCVLKNRR